ncbi:MAG: major capsid protein [Microviridae sp.]|nr:MAG: major capsid protein [Microviridae sp.]
MSRNQNSRFATNPTNLDISRSKFERSHTVKTSFNVGDIIPFYVDEVLPGDTFQIDTSRVVRLQTPITPFMDNIYLDTYYFFVPNRIVWEHWKQFQGENTESAWLPTTEYTVPQIVAPKEGFAEGTIADYFGIPTKVPGLSVNALPFRAYALICNEWFRDQNLCDPLNIPLNDATVTGVNTGVFVTDVAKGGLPYKAAKYHDYFTSALPAPQKGADVGIGLAGSAEVYGSGLSPSLGFGNVLSSGSDKLGLRSSVAGDTALSFNTNSATTQESFFKTKADGVNPLGLADLGTASAVTINELRLAFQMQKLLEKDARGGTRYVEILKSHFGVTSPDARLQRPEYLGGNRVPISVSQTVQTSQTTQDSPLGDTGAYSLTVDSHSDFTRSFTEHGFVIGLMVARYDHTYQYGLERQWSRKTRFDYYFPVLANIGEQAIKNKEIFAAGTSADDEVFGYQEAWADYRYKPSRVTGEMRSNSAKTLDFWHVADKYSELPKLSSAWIFEDKSNVDRVLEVTSAVANQLFADIYIRNYTTRPMPLYSIPGLVDHH